MHIPLGWVASHTVSLFPWSLLFPACCTIFLPPVTTVSSLPHVPQPPSHCPQLKILLSRLAGWLAKMPLSHFVRWILSLPGDTRYSWYLLSDRVSYHPDLHALHQLCSSSQSSASSSMHTHTILSLPYRNQSK